MRPVPYLPPSCVQKTDFDLPGFTLPLNFSPAGSILRRPSMCRNVHEVHRICDDLNQDYWWDVDRIRTQREVVMMRIMNKVTDTPGWETWTFHDDIVSETVTHEDGPGAPVQNAADAKKVEVTPNMKKYVTDELRWMANEFQRTKSVMVFDACVKSDVLIPPDLREALVDATHSLEESQAHHAAQNFEPPGIVDIVDPSSFPLIYGRSKILPDRFIGLEECIPAAWSGITFTLDINDPQSDPPEERNSVRTMSPWYDQFFQQLPCDVSPSENGCRIVSYINNVHPDKHQAVYVIIEKFLANALPLLTDALNYHLLRERIYLPEIPVPEADMDGSETDFEEDDGFNAWVESLGIQIPEPCSFDARTLSHGIENRLDLQAKLQERGLQVIVKIESVELVPARPDIAQEDWHLEGQPNEHICATAVYCFEADNITEQSFSFRQRWNFKENFEDRGGQYWPPPWLDYLEEIYHCIAGVEEIGAGIVTQVLGSVAVPSGRLLTFPNAFQQRRSGLSLIDKSRPGHCKTLFLYLVDPHIRIISTANVPPQRDDWRCEDREGLIYYLLHSRLPTELVAEVDRYLGDDLLPPISMDEALAHKVDMSRKRAYLATLHNALFEKGTRPTRETVNY